MLHILEALDNRRGMIYLPQYQNIYTITDQFIAKSHLRNSINIMRPEQYAKISNRDFLNAFYEISFMLIKTSLVVPQRSNWLQLSTGSGVGEMDWRWNNDNLTNDPIFWQIYLFKGLDISSLVLLRFRQLFGEDANCDGTLGTVPTSYKTYYPTTPQSIEGCKTIIKCWNLPGVSAAVLPRHLANFIAIWAANIESLGFETLRDLRIKHRIGYWNTQDHFSR